ncbi:hypothetical protein PC113_g13680 [Phytophthora cactorum]|uniref:Ubiquitin-like protease family profile domain-containing protein n=1 Tax=Phytophthora cactorum TaxID=29920 RepID=A0A8T1BVK3_9STRA|nr:hypothetical protein PC113_g13680 [Phytophthora cactorum]KAG2911012.1 hypothetical protein PC115_g12698 [Phytophthora cactorum]
MARSHKTVQIKAKMAEQEHAAEEARQAGLARLRAARTHSDRSPAREMMQKDQAGETSATAEGDTQESAEEATDEAVEEEADGEIAQEDASASDDDEADDEEEKAADEEEEDEDAEHKQEVATPFMANICKAHSQAGGGSLSEAEKYRHAQQSFGHISGELARDSAWLNDDAMHGFAVFLARYKYNVTVVISPPKTYKVAQKKKATEGLLPATTLDKIGEGVVSHPFVLLQVNFGGTHWGCLVVDRGAKLVKMYDSMGGKRNRKRLQNMAAEIRAGPLHYDSYNDLEVTEPMQTDSDSCGVFVYRLFWTCVSSKAPSGVSPAGVTKLRWDMLHAIMKVQPR